jgi:hypothetical protein
LDRKGASPIPEPIEQLRRQLDEFRSSRPQRTKLPEGLWQTAVELARQYGLYAVSRPLRLDYTKLKARLGNDGAFSKNAAAPAFVELVGAPAATVAECLIEFESTLGSKMRIQWKGPSAPDWPSLLRAWREAER